MSWSNNSSLKSSLSSGTSWSGSDVVRDEEGDAARISWVQNDGPDTIDGLPHMRIRTSGSKTRLLSRTSIGRSTNELREVDDRVFYADPDFVTHSGDQPGNTKQEQRNLKGTFDLERWWLTAPLWMRMLPFLLFLFLLLSAAHLVYAIICFAKIGQEWAAVPDPYACDTPGCLAIVKTLKATINPRADPCTDFYEYACGRYVNMEQDPDATPDIPRLTHAFQSNTLNAYLSEMLKLRGDKSDKIVEFYKSCIDEKTRLKVGLDPLLKIIVELFPTGFGGPSAKFTAEEYEKETINIVKTLNEFPAFHVHLRPNYTLALSRPDWVVHYRDYFLRNVFWTIETRHAYEIVLGKFFDKLWDRMKKLKLIKERPMPGEEAAELFTTITFAVSQLVYHKITHKWYGYTMNYVDDQEYFRKASKSLLTKVLGRTDFKVVNSEVLEEQFAFGDWDGLEGGRLGSIMVMYEGRGRYLDQLLTVFRKKPLPKSQARSEEKKALHILYIYLFLHSFVGDILPKTFDELELGKIFPGRFQQDILRFVRIESSCMNSMVYYLNAFARFRFYKFSDHEALRKTEVKIEQLSQSSKQSMRRWHTTQNERAGDFDSFTHHITGQFFSVRNPIYVEFPLPKMTEELKARLKRQMSYFDNWTVDPSNYLANIVKVNELINIGRLRDWQKNKLQLGDSTDMSLDYVHVSTANRVYTEYRNTIGLPLLVMNPPYFNNDMRVLDYAGTGIYMTRSQLILWNRNVLDPGSLHIPKEFLAGLSRTIKVGRKERNCQTVSSKQLDGGLSSFSVYIDSEEGIHSLAIKLAYDLYKHPDDFEGLIDLDTGETFKLIRHKDRSTEFIAPEFFPNGTVIRWYWKRTANGTVTSKEPVNKYRFVSPETFGRDRLQYTKLFGMEQYNRDQLFFLHSAGDHCFSSHKKNSERYIRHRKLLNGIYRQVPEFALAFECSSNSFMNPSDSCFVDDDEVTLGHVSTEDLLEED